MDRERQNGAQAEPSGEEAASSQTRLRELTRNLTERVKELKCLYGISHLFEDEKLTLDEILQGVINFVPPAWQFPEVTCARIKLKNREFVTANFRETAWKQSQDILVNGKRFGSIEVYYLEEMPPSDEGPFLKEERNLIYVIAERLGHTIGRNIAEKNVKFLYHRERELRQKLQQQMRVRVDFTRKLMHELKTPLTSLIAMSQLLNDETRGEKYEKLAKYIWESANNLNNRIEELHDVIRGETGILRLSPKQLKIGELLHSLVEETRPQTQQCGMTMELELEEDLPEAYADPERLRQVMLNLINNACKYAREGGKITIRGTRLEQAIQIEVKDYGPGIPSEIQATLFEPGYQVAYHEERTGGLGIGLALCKTLVELHGGRIWAKSRAGKGSSFYFTVPVKEVKS